MKFAVKRALGCSDMTINIDYGWLYHRGKAEAEASLRKFLLRKIDGTIYL